MDMDKVIFKKGFLNNLEDLTTKSIDDWRIAFNVKNKICDCGRKINQRVNKYYFLDHKFFWGNWLYFCGYCFRKRNSKFFMNHINLIMFNIFKKLSKKHNRNYDAYEDFFKKIGI